SEAELHILRARLDGGIRNKAARGELYRGQPIGFVRGEADAQILVDPDEAVQGAIRAVFERFAEFGSARRVWRWFLMRKLDFPHRAHQGRDVRWEPPSYHTIHNVLTNPVYAGAYAYGKSRRERHVDENGNVRTRIRKLPRSEWQVLIHDHHPGYIDWPTHEAILKRLASNTRPQAHGAGDGAVREGRALLQGIGSCGDCGRRLATHYTGRTASPGYHCKGKTLVEERRALCLYVGAVQIDRAVSRAVLEAIQPAGLEASLLAVENLETGYDRALEQWRLAVERARYEAERAERRYRAVEPEHRLVARGLEKEWEQCLTALKDAQHELESRKRKRPRQLTAAERDAILALGGDLGRAWEAPTTTPRDKKQLLRTVLEEVMVSAPRGEYRIHLTLRWRTGLLSEIELERPHKRRAAVRTNENTVDLVRRLARFHSDSVIAAILNQQGKTTAYGHRFNIHRVGNLRRHWNIPCFDPKTSPTDGELVNVRQAAKILGVATSTVHRWLNDGFIDGEQITPGAPWRIRIDEAFRPRFMEQAPPGYVPMPEATRRLGVSRQTVLQRVKRGEIDAIHIRVGRRKALRIKVQDDQPSLFADSS
ncbi:MAG: recombinase family protein, partial [Rhodospirillaceae bacterium]|nr:recombinase family protein [Rhodospirillaceae bacterium]